MTSLQQYDETDVEGTIEAHLRAFTREGNRGAYPGGEPKFQAQVRNQSCLYVFFFFFLTSHDATFFLGTLGDINYVQP